MKKQIYILKDVESGSFDDVTTDNFYLLVDDIDDELGAVAFSNSYNDLDDLPTSSSATGLEAINEGNGIGWRLIGKTAANYGNIGSGAVDLSQSSGSSLTRGATGINSFAAGANNIASAQNSVVIGGVVNESSNVGSVVIGGTSNIASGVESFIGGGSSLRARSKAESVFGLYATDYTPVNPTGHSPTDRVFLVGKGVGQLSRSDAFTILKNGKLGVGHNNFETTTSEALLNVNGAVQTAGYTVATLPAGTIGMRTFVTDARVPTYLGTLTGGGTVTCPVFYNGSDWVSA